MYQARHVSQVVPNPVMNFAQQAGLFLERGRERLLPALRFGELNLVPIRKPPQLGSSFVVAAPWITFARSVIPSRTLVRSSSIEGLYRSRKKYSLMAQTAQATNEREKTRVRRIQRSSDRLGMSVWLRSRSRADLPGSRSVGIEPNQCVKCASTSDTRNSPIPHARTPGGVGCPES